MEWALAWWRARTERERRLVHFAAILIFVLLAPSWAYVSAREFREGAAIRLAAARQTEQQVERIAEVSHGQAAEFNNDASVRGRVVAIAQASGLTPMRIEAVDAGRVRIHFESADSLAIYRWIEAVGRSGAYVTRSVIIRVDDGDLVDAEFEVADSP